MFQIYHNTLQKKKLRKVREPISQSWISLVEPTRSEINRLSAILNLPYEVLEDSLDEFELPRVKIHNNNLIIILRAAVRKNEYETFPFTVIMNDDYIVTITTKVNPIIKEFARGEVEIFTTQKSNFFIKICLRIVEYYQNYIAVINRRVQLKKRKNLNNINKQDILVLVETEEILNKLIASLAPTINVIKKILHNNYIQLYHQDKELIDDLLVDGEQVLELALTNLKTIKNIRDGYTTVMSINLNQIMKILTYITAIFTIPMVVASIYGMNIRLPLADRPDAFTILMEINFIFILLAIGLFVYYRKKI